MFGKCRCCLKAGNHKDILKCYYRKGVAEVYRNMFLDCFNLFLNMDPKMSSLICESCVKQLQDASDFRTMVAESEQQQLRQIGNKDTVFINVPGVNLNSELDIKEEEFEVKQEHETENDFDPGDAVEIEDDHNGYSFADEDMIDGELALVSRFPGLKPLPTRQTLHLYYPDFSTHLELLRDKTITTRHLEKLLEESEIALRFPRKRESMSEKTALITNSLILLENSNLTPFKSKTRAGFPCFYCRNTFENLREIKEHQMKNHSISELRKLLKSFGAESFMICVDATDLKCTICDQNIRNMAELKSHLVKVHKKVYRDDVTDRVIPFKLSDNNVYVCQICGFSLETFGSIERHMNTHYRNYVCNDCGTGFVTKYRLKVHTKSMHIEGRYPCEPCRKVFASQQKLKNHVDTVHKLVKRFKCPKCSERFTEYFKRQKHLVDKHGVAPLRYKCNVCDKSFDRRYTLSRHMKRDHLEERDFQCDKCSYKCFTNNELRVHMIKHGGERIYECSVCNKAYARKKTLREHMRIHNNERRFSCAVCGHAFVQKCSLKAHIRTHHVEYNEKL